MQTVTIFAPNGEIQAEYANSFFTRFCGLMGKGKLPKGKGMIFDATSSIHMLFMRFAIDAVFLDKDRKILSIHKSLRPWTGLAICMKAYYVIELGEGEAERLGFKTGEKIKEWK